VLAGGGEEGGSSELKVLAGGGEEGGSSELKVEEFQSDI